ncbi:MAG: polysaccharide biosynthesis protein [Candidatus Firestonebacteria bacterium]
MAEILRRFPKIQRLVIFSRDELKQYEMAQKFNDQQYPALRYFIGDVRDRSRLKRALEGIDTVIHAAALKHVPAAEYNPMEFIHTNVLGAENLIEACMDTGVKRVVALSTDKAAAPINLYGATKLCSDKLFVAANNYIGRDTVLSVVRYGNVMGSRGSVIPLFVEQIKAGKPLTITDPDMTRFLMNLEDAVELVVFAYQNAGAGDIMVQKSPASTIGDLAQAVKEIFNAKNEIKIIGTRHGEKKFETLLTREEYVVAEDMGKYFRVPSDKRDLNYDKYFSQGDKKLSTVEEYNSNNTQLLNVKQVKEKVLELKYIKAELKEWAKK